MTPTTTSSTPLSFRRAGLGAAVNAERLKFFSIKTGPVTAGVVAAAIVFAAVLSSLSLIAPSGNQNPDAVPITSVAPVRFVDTVLWMAIVYAVAAALFATTEYSSQQIQVTLLAVPRRARVVVAKAVIIGGVGFAVGAVASLIAMLVPFAVLNSSDVEYAASMEEIGRLSLASGLFLAFTGIVALTVGLLARNVIVSIAVPVLAFSILPSILESIGNPVITTLVGYFPTIAGRVILTTFDSPAGLDAWPGMAVLALWGIVLTVVASVVIRMRDA